VACLAEAFGGACGHMRLSIWLISVGLCRSTNELLIGRPSLVKNNIS
jgi:hypothetical protein